MHGAPPLQPANPQPTSIMASSSTKTKSARSRSAHPKQCTRLWLMYPARLIRTPVVWQLSQKFQLITNVRQASVTDEIGVVGLELEGPRNEIKAAIKWLERLGIRVEPVEINVIES
jgi:L-aspartate semialdehyde sulfurtransferase ferredoxin